MLRFRLILRLPCRQMPMRKPWRPEAICPNGNPRWFGMKIGHAGRHCRERCAEGERQAHQSALIVKAVLCWRIIDEARRRRQGRKQPEHRLAAEKRDVRTLRRQQRQVAAELNEIAKSLFVQTRICRPLSGSPRQCGNAEMSVFGGALLRSQRLSKAANPCTRSPALSSAPARLLRASG